MQIKLYFNNALCVLQEDSDSIQASDVQIPVPPGYWRYGGKTRQSKGILLRFAKLSDKKPHGAEVTSEYYRKHGNPNFGGEKGDFHFIVFFVEALLYDVLCLKKTRFFSKAV
jgi:hypothetical protein